jgi:hypothetical protein
MESSGSGFRTSSLPTAGSGGGAALSHAASAGAAVLLQRRGSVGPPTGSPTAAAGSKHADVYLTELLSYSLDRLRKVGRRDGEGTWGSEARDEHASRPVCTACAPFGAAALRPPPGLPFACLPIEPTAHAQRPPFPPKPNPQEPELLAEERRQLERAQQSSALAHYTAFVDAAGGLEAVAGALKAALARLEALQEVGGCYFRAAFSAAGESGCSQLTLFNCDRTAYSWHPARPLHHLCNCSSRKQPLPPQNIKTGRPPPLCDLRGVLKGGQRRPLAARRQQAAPRAAGDALGASRGAAADGHVRPQRGL